MVYHTSHVHEYTQNPHLQDHPVTPSPRGASTTLGERAKILAQANRYLAKIADKAQKHAPLALGRFGALVFSTGGLIKADTQKQLASWKEAIGDSTWSWTLRRISLSLVRARARTFAM